VRSEVITITTAAVVVVVIVIILITTAAAATTTTGIYSTNKISTQDLNFSFSC